MLKLIEKVFSYLPFNGKKTPIGVISLLLSLYLPEVDPALIETLGNKTVQLWQELSEMLAVIGVLHGQIKRKLGK